MSETTAYENGRPSWIDATSTDIAATTAFYEGLFGWHLTDLGPETGGYVICRLNGKRVAALIQRTEGDPAAPHWTIYLACDDLDAAVEKVRAAGGTVAVDPMDVLEEGRLAYAVDPTGAWVGLWQARNFIGAELANEPGAFTWAELRTRDVEAALRFYQAVFGYEVRTSAMGQIAYHELALPGAQTSIAGAFAMPDEMFAPDVPAHWAVYLGIDDLDRGAGRVRELGGRQLMEPVSIPMGRFAAFADPVGAAFSLFEANREPRGSR
jgi:uncharacterized protein